MRKAKHLELLEAVNGAKTDEEHALARARVDGFRSALEACGFDRGLLVMEGDMFYIDRGVERPMCGGEFLDWRATP